MNKGRLVVLLHVKATGTHFRDKGFDASAEFKDKIQRKQLKIRIQTVQKPSTPGSRLQRLTLSGGFECSVTLV